MRTIRAVEATPARPRERTTIVRTMDDFTRVAAIRAIAYMAEQDCPYDEEFDGNDFCAMHLLGWLDGEPAACLRIRFFGDFAKLERLAVRPDRRRSTLAFRLVRHGLRLAARKGYRFAYGHAQEGLEDFWGRFGAQPVGDRSAFQFSGRRYTEMMVELPAHNEAIRIGADPLVIIRPEGDWDRPGILEGDARPVNFETPDPVAPEIAEIRAREPIVPESWTADLQAAWRAWIEPPPRLRQAA